MNQKRTLRTVLSALANDTRGSVTTEYVVLMGLVGLVSLSGFVAIGVALSLSFSDITSQLLYPFP